MGSENRSEIPKTMLILKAKASSLATAEMFLRNRGWIIYSTTDVKEALLLVVQRKFSYFLVSLDHPNKKTDLIPSMIHEKFPMAVMAFTETPLPSSYQKLNELTCDYKIYHPVTGPAIERAVSKYVRDQQTIEIFSLDSLPPMPEMAAKKVPPPPPKTNGALIYRKNRNHLPKHYGVVYMPGRKSKEIMGLIANPRFENNHAKLRSWSPPPRRTHVSETLMVRGAERSLQSSVEHVRGVTPEKITHSTVSECILVESDRFSGYLITALGSNKKMEPSLVANIRRLLFQFLRENGEYVKENEATTVQLKPVDFEPWAKEYAEFLKKSVHRGDEVALAFFPRRPLQPRFEDGAREDMIKIKIKDLKGDHPVEFNLYLHLEGNNKYVLYTPKGGVIYNRQLERLTKQGVTHMHVSRKELGFVAKYNAQNYINSLVDDYVSKKLKKSERPMALP